MSPILQSLANASAFGFRSAAAIPTSFESIATYTSTGSAGDIEFTSIPGTYKHLQLRGLLRTNDSGSFNNQALRFNGDTGSNYSLHRMVGNQTTVTANATTNIGSINDFMRAISDNQAANTFSAVIIDILDYADTNKYKVIRVLNGQDINGSGEIILVSGLWESTSAITSLKILPSGGTAITNSTFALYGIKGPA